MATSKLKSPSTVMYFVSGNCRDFLSDGLIEWAKKHPHVKIRVQQLANRHPVVYGEYGGCCGRGCCCDLQPRNCARGF